MPSYSEFYRKGDRQILVSFDTMSELEAAAELLKAHNWKPLLADFGDIMIKGLAEPNPQDVHNQVPDPNCPIHGTSKIWRDKNDGGHYCGHKDQSGSWCGAKWDFAGNLVRKPKVMEQNSGQGGQIDF